MTDSWVSTFYNIINFVYEKRTKWMILSFLFYFLEYYYEIFLPEV